VQTPDAANISTVVLMRNGAVTHAFDMDQRHVGLSFTPGAGVLNVTGPPNGNIAPPGYYMLFILNNAGVPSIATMLQVSLAANDVPPTGTIISPASNLTISAGQSVSYSGTGSDPDETISAYSWSLPGGNPSSSNLANPGSVTYATPGTYVTIFTVTDNAGLADPNPPTRTITVQPDFSLSASPSSQTVVRGSGTSFTATVTAGTGFTGTVSLGVSGLPAGATASFSPASVSTSGSSTLSVSTGSSTASGSYPLTITGTSGSLVHTTTVTLTIGTIISVSSVQVVANGVSGPTSSLSLSFPSSTVAGDVILVAFDYDANAMASSVTDSQGNAFTAVGNQLTSPGGTRSRVYYAKNIKGGTDTVTVHLSANSGWIELYLTEYTGVDQTNPIDAQAGASGSAGSVSSGNATTTAAGDVIYGYCVADWACTVGSGFAARSTFNNNLVEDQLAGNVGIYVATASANNGWTMQMVALKPASGLR
jgi:hypothetical protein